MSGRHIGMLVTVSTIWGSSYVLQEIALRELAPAALITGRFVLASLGLAAAVLVLPVRKAVAADLGSSLTRIALVGAVGTALPVYLVAWGQQHVDSGVVAVLAASSPLFTALLALLFVPAERVTGIRLVGFLVGFVGIVLLVGGDPASSGRAVAGSAAIIVSACFYAGCALYVSARLNHVSPVAVAVGSLGAAAVFALPFGFATRPSSLPSWEAITALAGLALPGTSFALFVYFALVREAGASRAALITYLAPALAVLFGWALLGEQLTAARTAGILLVLGGVALGTGAAARDLLRRPKVAAPALEAEPSGLVVLREPTLDFPHEAAEKRA